VIQQKAFFPPEISSGSPTEGLEHPKPLGVSSILERWGAILSAPQPVLQDYGKWVSMKLSLMSMAE